MREDIVEPFHDAGLRAEIPREVRSRRRHATDALASARRVEKQAHFGLHEKR